MHVPEVVQRALAKGRESGFDKSCTPQVGRLLQLLTAATGPGSTVSPNTVAELGTGCDVGSAWLLSGLPEEGRLISVDSSPAHHQAVTELFGDAPNAQFLCGSWREALPYRPVSLIFVDVGEAKDAGAAAVVEALAVGGVAVLDDFTPEAHWPPEWRGRPDKWREFWLRHPQLRATEILTTPETAAILAVRVR